MQAIFKFKWDCGRAGEVTSVFVATEEEVANAIGSYVYFGEILGKHSEVHGMLEEEHVTFVTDEPAFVNLFLKHDLTTGYNPLDYISGEDEEFEDEDYDEGEMLVEDGPTPFMLDEGNDCIVNNCQGSYKIVSLMDSFSGRLTCTACGDNRSVHTEYYK